MIHGQGSKWFSIAPPKAISDNAAVATTALDLIGAKYVVVSVYFGATDIAMAALKLQHADADTGYADITGSDLASLAVDTADNKCIRYYLKPSKRWLDLVMTTGDGSAGTFVAAWADVWYDELPNSDTERGLLTSAFLQPA